MSVVVRRYTDILTIIINFPYSTCISSFFGSSIPTYFFVHFKNIKTEKTFKNEHRSKDAAAKKRPNTSGVGKINNYYEDIYIPPNNNTD